MGMKKKLSVTDTSPHSVVVSMANALEVDYRDNKYEYVLELPKAFGEGFVKSYAFKDGFGVVHTNYKLAKDFYFQLEKGAVHPLKLIFNAGDIYNHKLENSSAYTDINFSEVIIVSSTRENNHHFMIPAGVSCDLFSIEVNRKRFENRIMDFTEDMDIELASLFRDLNGVIPFSYKGPYSYDIGVMIEEFKNCRLAGMNGYLYLEAKAYEIFTSFLEQYLDDTKKPDKRSIFRQNQTRFIKQTGMFIRENLESIPTVQGLAQKFGLSSNILQNGFRSIYGMSVNEFIQNERLLMIKKLLTESDYSISEITYMVGLNSKSYLSKIFFERFSMTPSDFRANVKKKDGGTL